jgi:hypothetical protein
MFRFSGLFIAFFRSHTLWLTGDGQKVARIPVQPVAMSFLHYFIGSALMAQRTSIEDDIGVKSPLSIEALGPVSDLQYLKKYDSSKPLIACGTPRISAGFKIFDKSDDPHSPLVAGICC